MKHTYTVATTILVDIESDQELTDAQLREIMNECDYTVKGSGLFITNHTRYEISDTEMEDWCLVAAREEA